ncbi:MAG: peptide chain release factor N(5)-glutamine methyltransferase, partial [bacterium]
EAEILLCHVLKTPRSKLFSHPERKLTRAEQKLYDELLDRRKKHEPIAYIVQNQPFMSLDFYVNPNVLIPRPETELLVEQAINSLIPHTSYPTPIIADIGTGSGCIAITLAKYLPKAKIIAIDSSKEALKIAERNAKTHRVIKQIEFRLGNLLKPLKEKVDLIISNPPYIPRAEIEKLDPDVKDFEPRAALDGGVDGLDYIRKLISQSPSPLKPHTSSLLLEIGYNQGAKAKELAKHYAKVEVIKDLSGHDRILKCSL